MPCWINGQLSCGFGNGVRLLPSARLPAIPNQPPIINKNAPAIVIQMRDQSPQNTTARMSTANMKTNYTMTHAPPRSRKLLDLGASLMVMWPALDAAWRDRQACG